MNRNSRFSRRTFITSMTVAGAGSALSAFRLPENPDLTNVYRKMNSTAASENKSDNILLKRLIPQPEHVHLNDVNEVKLDNTLKVKY